MAALEGDADQRQVETLCDDLAERAETAREEQVLLGQLAEVTERTRPYQSRQYRAMLEQVRMRYQRVRELIVRYCS
jgi:hypothetical protein